MPKTIETLNLIEIGNLLVSLTPTGNYNRRDYIINRNLLMILLMLDAGLRVGEVVRLIVSDLYLQGSFVTTLTVRAEISKSKYERQIPLSFRLRTAIEAFSQHCCPLRFGWLDAPAFTTTNKFRAITARQVQRIVEQLSLKSIGRKIHPHVLRHTFATRLMAKTNIRVVQELLGHKSITSTQIYTHPNSTDLREAINAI